MTSILIRTNEQRECLVTRPSSRGATVRVLIADADERHELGGTVGCVVEFGSRDGRLVLDNSPALSINPNEQDNVL